MEAARPFAGLNARPSPWGYNWNSEVVSNHGPTPSRKTQPPPTQTPEPCLAEQQYAQLPAQLLSALKRDKKPFTYTPGGVNLNQVLEARLQKRIERKKKYNEEKPPKQVVVMQTYNSPLDMYSMENAVEALEMQADLVANDSSLGSRSATLPRNHRFSEKDMDPSQKVVQSKAFKVLQIITDTDQDMNHKGPQDPPDTEMRFRGLRDSSAIPSRFFQTLQKITGTEQDEEDYDTGYEQEVFRPVTPSNNPPRQPSSQPRPMMVHQPSTESALRRPAAFLPAKTGMPNFKPVRPAFLANKVKTGVTDF